MLILYVAFDAVIVYVKDAAMLSGSIDPGLDLKMVVKVLTNCYFSNPNKSLSNYFTNMS